MPRRLSLSLSLFLYAYTHIHIFTYLHKKTYSHTGLPPSVENVRRRLSLSSLYVYTHTYLYVYTHTHTYTYTCTCRPPSAAHPWRCTNTSPPLSLCIYIHIYVSTQANTYIHTYIYMYYYIHTHIYQPFIYMHVYIHIYIPLYVCTHIYIHIHTGLRPQCVPSVVQIRRRFQLRCFGDGGKAFCKHIPRSGGVFSHGVFPAVLHEYSRGAFERHVAQRCVIARELPRCRKCVALYSPPVACHSLIHRCVPQYQGREHRVLRGAQRWYQNSSLHVRARLCVCARERRCVCDSSTLFCVCACVWRKNSSRRVRTGV